MGPSEDPFLDAVRSVRAALLSSALLHLDRGRAMKWNGSGPEACVTCTLPRKFTTCSVGFTASSCAWRRSDADPTVAPSADEVKQSSTHTSAELPSTCRVSDRWWQGAGGGRWFSAIMGCLTAPALSYAVRSARGAPRGGGGRGEGRTGQLGDGLVLGGEEGVAHILALEVAGQHSALRQVRGNVLHGVHGDVDAAAQQRHVQLAREQPLAADIRQRLVQHLVPW